MQIAKATIFNRRSGEMWEFTALAGQAFPMRSGWGKRVKARPHLPAEQRGEIWGTW